MSADRDMLRTVLLTEPAVQALGGFPVVHGKALVVHIRLFPRYFMEILSSASTVPVVPREV